MKLADLEILVVGNPPPGFGGRYFIFVKLTTDDGITGWGEVYAATVGPAAMRAVIEDVFARHMAGESPESIELMFRRVYSAGFTQRPDPTVMGAFSGLEIACWDILGKARDRPVYALWGGRVRDRLRSLHLPLPRARARIRRRFYNDPDASAAARRPPGRRGLHRGEVRPRRRLHHLRRPPADARRPRPLRGLLPRASARRSATAPTCSSAPTASSPRPARSASPGASRPTTRCGSRSRSRPTLPLEIARVAAQSPVPIADRRAADDQGRVRHACSRRRRRRSCSRASAASAGCCEARKIAGDGRGLRRPDRAAPLRRADRLGRRRSSSPLSIPNFLILEAIGTGGGFHAEPAERRRSPGRTATSCPPTPPASASSSTRRSPAPIPGPATACTSR